MMWSRGKILGKGGSAMVFLAEVASPTRNDQPSVMAVKSAPFYTSHSLFKERMLLSEFEGCPHILSCFGEDLTIEDDGEQWYNIMLEYAAGGSLADRIQSCIRGGGLPECEVKRYTKSVLMGLSYIHKKGYVHCDIKPHNILLVESDNISMSLNGKRKRVHESTAKIADLGLAKKAGKRLKEKEKKLGLRGTALYMAPESIMHQEYEPNADIWALGCTVLEMITGKEPWKRDQGTEAAAILFRIGFAEQIPEIPSGLSIEAQDFLKKCLVRDPKSRWTADMLLGHPFVTAADGAFTGSIKEERNRVVLPKAVCDPSLQSSFNLSKPYLLLMSHSASDGLIPNSCMATMHLDGMVSEDFGEFPASKMQKRMEEDAEEGLSRTSFRLDALGQYWGIKRIAEIPNSNIAIEIFN